MNYAEPHPAPAERPCDALEAVLAATAAFRDAITQAEIAALLLRQALSLIRCDGAALLAPGGPDGNIISHALGTWA